MGERNIDWLPLARVQTEDQTLNPGIWPDRESNQRPFTFCGIMPNKLSHTSQGNEDVLIYINIFIFIPVQS